MHLRTDVFQLMCVSMCVNSGWVFFKTYKDAANTHMDAHSGIALTKGVRNIIYQQVSNFLVLDGFYLLM